MKVKLSKDDLLQGIQTVQNVVSPKATLPILSNMLIETKKDTLLLNTTDLDIGISCEIPVNIVEDGAITIPAKRFNQTFNPRPIELYAGDHDQPVVLDDPTTIEDQNLFFRLESRHSSFDPPHTRWD